MSNKPFRIAISGKSGCGNTTVSTHLAEKLGFKLVNYTFHTIAEETGMDFREICLQAEEDNKWDYLVDKKQVEMAMEKSSVLGSRLAVWMLKEADLKVFLTASEEVRARRIQKREGGSIQQRMDETEARDKRDHLRYMKLYNIDNNDYGFCDFILDTDKLTPDDIVQLLLEEVKKRIDYGDRK